MKQDTPQTVTHFDSGLRVHTQSVDRLLHVIEKVASQAYTSVLVEHGRLRHFVVGYREKAIADHLIRWRALAIASSPETDCNSPLK